MNNRTYFDHAATTPIDGEVVEAMVSVMKDFYGNPSSVHASGREARALIEDARKKVSKLLNCSPGEIFFTSGGTEADNMAIRKSVDCLGIKNIITSPIEHHAVLHTIEELDKRGRIKKHFVHLLPNGHVDLSHLQILLEQNENALVSLMHVNNEIGNLLDIEKVGALCEQFNALFHSDTVQSVGNFPIDLQKIHIDFIACAAHKFNGPKGVGFIYISGRNKIDPFITGGSQERDMRGGTENIYGIAGLAKALEIAYRDLEKRQQYLREIRSAMIEKLRENIPGVGFNGDAEGNSSYTILNVSFPPNPVAEMMLFKLDIAGVSASGGSACASGSNVGSHVLTAIGADANRPAIRFSFGKKNTMQEVDKVIGYLVDMVKVKEIVK